MLHALVDALFAHKFRRFESCKESLGGSAHKPRGEGNVSLEGCIIFLFISFVISAHLLSGWRERFVMSRSARRRANGILNIISHSAPQPRWNASTKAENNSFEFQFRRRFAFWLLLLLLLCEKHFLPLSGFNTSHQIRERLYADVRARKFLLCKQKERVSSYAWTRAVCEQPWVEISFQVHHSGSSRYFQASKR